MENPAGMNSVRGRFQPSSSEMRAKLNMTDEQWVQKIEKMQ